LASEYGWSKDDIYNHVYVDELMSLIPVIKNRKMDDYRMRLAIAQNPHAKDPKKLWRSLQSKKDRTEETKLDESGFEIFKSRLSRSSKIQVK
jgi:hypothetical protein